LTTWIWSGGLGLKGFGMRPGRDVFEAIPEKKHVRIGGVS